MLTASNPSWYVLVVAARFSFSAEGLGFVVSTDQAQGWHSQHQSDHRAIGCEAKAKNCHRM